ncbi:hypothetical protein FisN_5Lu012 [Fistulifera solaris]|uniref:CXXC-type domain-containing protein n=1 Tax=Fistulifera solaris TaxID=1519565 RepID=A0A1Z5JJV2_FISSO|nr:hypothetical protein FisN_5Lu012 [Fistulifera solaris]|eukprot:GAX14068.1 hypothetical protein FisN_5Lu012 [Fistulifera solaris]
MTECDASDPSFVTAPDVQEEEKHHQSKPSPFKCDNCSSCHRGVCNICIYCKKRDAFTRKTNRCPFLVCDSASYSISSIKDYKRMASRAVEADPDRLSNLYEKLYGDTGFMTKQQTKREKERQSFLVKMYGQDEITSTGQRTIMLRSKFESKPNSVAIKEEDDNSFLNHKMVPIRVLRKRKFAAIEESQESVITNRRSPNKSRHDLCQKCEGCLRQPCGLCLRCTSSRSCVFWICHNYVYKSAYKQKLMGRIMSSLKHTANECGDSPLQILADAVMAGPLSSHLVRKGCHEPLLQKCETDLHDKSTGRSQPCGSCDGCTTTDCGLCVHCQGMGYGDRYKCIFRMCHDCDYAPRTLMNMAGYVLKSLDLTRNQDGTSPLDCFAMTIVNGPLASVAGKIAEGIAERASKKAFLIKSEAATTKRISACGKCRGCSIKDCGLCIHCKGMSLYGRRKCVFRICHEVEYAYTSRSRMIGHIEQSLTLTRRNNGTSPLDNLAKAVMEGPFASHPRKIAQIVEKCKIKESDKETTTSRVSSRLKRSDLEIFTTSTRPCGSCAGCMFTDCGLCIHCKGMGHGGRCRCVFRICQKRDYAPSTMISQRCYIRKSLALTRRSDGSSPLDSTAKAVMEGLLVLRPRKYIDLVHDEDISAAGESNGSCSSKDSHELLRGENEPDASPCHWYQSFFGLPHPGYLHIKGLGWNDDTFDWKEFILTLEALSDTERQSAIYFNYQQAIELSNAVQQNHTEIQKLERALIASIFLLVGLPSSPEKVLLDKARHSVLLYSLHFEDDRRLMTMLTSNLNYQGDLQRLLKNSKLQELEPRDFAKKVRDL